MTNVIGMGDPHKLIDADETAAPVTGTSFYLPSPGSGKLIGWRTSFAEAPDSCQIKLQHSIDGEGWADLDESTAVAGETKICTLTPANYLRAVKSAQSGGGALTVIAVVTV